MELKPLPTSKQDAFVDSPLYASFSIEGWEEDALINFFLGSGTVDAWCPRCERPSVFRIASKLPKYNETKKSLPNMGTLEIAAFCTRGAEDSYSGCRFPLYIIFFKDDDEVRKIGQSPSAADLAFGSLDEAFSKELDADNRRELGTAIGLYSHSVGIGAFVYLRRIFESLIEEAHARAHSGDDWDEVQYIKARVPERIKLLRAHLPARLVSSSNLYSLLSVGVHELSEDSCLADFNLVKGAIELILRERHEDKRYAAVIKAVSARASTP